MKTSQLKPLYLLRNFSRAQYHKTQINRNRYCSLQELSKCTSHYSKCLAVLKLVIQTSLFRGRQNAPVLHRQPCCIIFRHSCFGQLLHCPIIMKCVSIAFEPSPKIFLHRVRKTKRYPSIATLFFSWTQCHHGNNPLAKNWVLIFHVWHLTSFALYLKEQCKYE